MDPDETQRHQRGFELDGAGYPILDGRYRLGQVVGRGGMATVYEGSDLRLNRKVAIKVFRRDVGDAIDLHRIQREIALLASLNSPHIVNVLDAQVAQSKLLYLVMEFVEGQDLRELLKSPEPPGTELVRRIVGDVAFALQALHEQGVVHRDIKPGNILVPAGGRARVHGVAAKLADFGIALALDATRLTSTDFVIGTPAYMSPEQVRSEPLAPSSDIYSLGLVLIECLTGRPPFPGSTTESAIARLIRTPELPPDASPALAGLLSRMTALEPDVRPSADEVCTALDGPLVGAMTGPASRDATTPLQPTRPAMAATTRLLPDPAAAATTPLFPPPPAATPVTAAARPAGPPQRSARPSVGSPWWRVLHSWWILMPILSFGLLTSVPFLVNGVRARRVDWWLPGLGWFVISIAMVSTSPDPISRWLTALAWLGGSLHVILINRSWLRWRAREAVAPWHADAEGDAARVLGSLDWRLGHSWWILLPLMSFGFLTAVPLVVNGIRTRRVDWWLPGLGWAVAPFAMAASSSSFGIWPAWLGGTLHVILINRRWLRWCAQRAAMSGRVGTGTVQAGASMPSPVPPTPAPEAAGPAGQEPAGHAASHAATVPGRLIDINRATGEDLQRELLLPAHWAERVVSTRTRLGRYGRLEQLVTEAGLPPHLYSGLHGRVVAF